MIIQPLPGEVKENENTGLFRITDWETKETGGEIPVWVENFLETGARGLEALPKFNNKYIFVASITGGNIRALRQWAAGFSIRQDFPRMAASRIEQRMVKTSTLYPDDEYGQYFENMVKLSSDTNFTDAVIDAAFWIYREIYEEDGVTVSQERYEYFILVSIDKPLLENQIRLLLDKVKTEQTPAREQVNSINRLKAGFFDNF
jgi:hypothetical protein